MHKLSDRAAKPYITVLASGNTQTTLLCVIVDGPVSDAQLQDLAAYLKSSTRMLLQLVEFGVEL